jgi:hypothetical protein
MIILESKIQEFYFLFWNEIRRSILIAPKNRNKLHSSIKIGINAYDLQ